MDDLIKIISNDVFRYRDNKIPIAKKVYVYLKLL